MELKALALANIVRVDIETEEETPKKYSLLEVADTAEATAFISAGKEEELRVQNTIHAQNNTEDIIKGYDLKFSTVKAIMPVLALVDGGSYDEATKTYLGPVVGKTTKRQLFTLHVYTEDKDYNSENKGFVRFTFKHCKGSPVSFALKDGTFLTNEMTLKARPRFGENAVEFAELDSLPDAEETPTPTPTPED